MLIMSFFKRLGTIISGTANKALDSIEDPEVVIPQQIREMEEAKLLLIA
jgi:phage shock protein A